jgi:hypothetical protein
MVTGGQGSFRVVNQYYWPSTGQELYEAITWYQPYGDGYCKTI